VRTLTCKWASDFGPSCASSRSCPQSYTDLVANVDIPERDRNRPEREKGRRGGEAGHLSSSESVNSTTTNFTTTKNYVQRSKASRRYAPRRGKYFQNYRVKALDSSPCPCSGRCNLVTGGCSMRVRVVPPPATHCLCSNHCKATLRAGGWAGDSAMQPQRKSSPYILLAACFQWRMWDTPGKTSSCWHIWLRLGLLEQRRGSQTPINSSQGE